MISRSSIRLSRSALVQNYRILSKKVPGKKMLPMVKADAYGHDAIFVAKSLSAESSLHGFGVATFNEAIELRNGIKRNDLPIVVFSDCAPWDQERSDLCLKYRLQPVFSELESLLRFQSSADSVRIGAHVEINTGMNRLGIPVDSLGLVKFYPKSMFTHLADADTPQAKLTQTQMAAFSRVVKDLRVRFPQTLLHFANSSAIWNHSKFELSPQMDLVRPGLSLYGIRPFPAAKNDGLKRVMRYTSRVLNRIYLNEGDRVGYGGTYRCRNPKGEWVAILGGGYADGIFRSLGNQGIAYHGSRKLQFLGRVSMDLSAIQGSARIKIGDEIELWGNQVDPYEQSALAGTIPYEITTRVGSRVERIYE